MPKGIRQNIIDVFNELITNNDLARAIIILDRELLSSKQDRIDFIVILAALDYEQRDWDTAKNANWLLHIGIPRLKTYFLSKEEYQYLLDDSDSIRYFEEIITEQNLAEEIIGEKND